MERRKILLGSGAALATVLAGCSSTETGDETDDTSDSSDGRDDTDTGTDDDSDDYDDVPGYDGDMETSSDALTVTSVSHEGSHIGAVVETETTDSAEIYAELETLAEDLAYAITDRDRFKAEIETIELYLEHDGARVLGLFVDVQWILDYLDDDISKDELVEKIRNSEE